MNRIIQKWQLLFDNLVIATVGSDNREAVRKVSLVYGLVFVGISVLCVLGLVAFFQSAFWLAVVDFFTVIFFISLVLYLRHTGNYVFCSYLGVSIIYWLYLLLFVTGGVDGTGFMWYYTFPLLALFLLGARAGAITSFLLFFPTVLFLIIDGRSPEAAIYTPSFSYRFVPSFITVVLFSYMYERNREKNQKNLENAYLRQDALIESRTRELAELNENLQKMVAEQTREIKTTQEQLIHAEKLSAIGSLVASIAHEFNNPLCGVSNVLNRIERQGLADTSNQKLVAMAVDECKRMKHLIQDLQAFNRPTSGLTRAFALEHPVDEILLLLQKEFSLKRIAVIKEYNDLPTMVNAVENQIKQVVLNLLKNAAEAIPDSGGTITIGTGQKGTDCVLTVHDTGSGIAPDVMGSIFEPFFTTKPAVKGTGLGLSVSHGLIKSHGGKIEVQSDVGRGTTFIVTLPIKENPINRESEHDSKEDTPD